MSGASSLWDALVRVIKIDDKVEQLIAQGTAHQNRLNAMHDRLVRVEAILEVALAKSVRSPTPKIAREQGK